MKRIIVSVGAIVIAFVIAFTGYFFVNRASDRLEKHLLDICEIAQEKDIEKANEMADNAITLWEDVHDTIESFIRHEETDKLEETIKSLPVYAQQGNMERLEQQADLAIDELNHLIRNEKPLISNIF